MSTLLIWSGNTIYNLLRRKNVSCEYIDSDSDNQSVVANQWNNNLLRVLITTTLGLVGNESARTQLVCIVGLHYNLPSIVQAYGRIRPKRRTKHSQCAIYTLDNNQARLKVAKSENTNVMNQLIGCGIMSSANEEKYERSMTMAGVNDWLFKDQGCRIVSLAGRLGFRHQKCTVCDVCTNANVNISAALKRKTMRNDNIRRNEGIRVLQRLKQKCIVCNNASCNGNCVASRRKRVTCYHCLGAHYASKCSKGYKNILKGKACFSCWVYNYDEDSIHDHSVCSADGGSKERFRALVQHDFLEKQKNGNNATSFDAHLAGIYASEETFFKFVYRYKDWK